MTSIERPFDDLDVDITSMPIIASSRYDQSIIRIRVDPEGRQIVTYEESVDFQAKKLAMVCAGK